MKGKTMKETPRCSICSLKNSDKACYSKQGRGPSFCPTLNKKDIIENAMEKYGEPPISEFARQSSIQEGECYINRDADPFVLHPVKPRVQETWEFAKKMNYKKLGVAFCIGLNNEARILSKILESKDLEVVSVCCKVGKVPKERIGIKNEEKVMIGRFESMCNPIAQAEILNEEKTDFNILVGLCVGHDSMFLKYSKAPATVLVVKDRVTGHNPVASLYNYKSYYQRLLT
jgi:uncharacterized metal-binding protein